MHGRARSFHLTALRIGIAFAVLLAALAGLGYWADENDNFHVITPGQAYRSAQLEAEELRGYLREYEMKSVLNLRGRQEGKTWYHEELKVCAEERVRHYDLALTAHRAPNGDEIEELLDIFAAAPRPILIHCEGGADRTGLAAAMWRMYVVGENKNRASAELSWRYGHLPLGRKKALDDFFAAWTPPGAAGSLSE